MVSQVKFVLGGTKLASASFDGVVRLWDLLAIPPNDVVEGRIGRAPSKLRSPIAFSPDGSKVATLSSNAMQILLWDAQTGASAGSLDTPPENGTILSADLAFSPNANLLAAARVCPGAQPVKNRPRVIEFWDLRHRVVTDSFPGQEPMSFSRNGRWFACQGTNGGTIQFRDMKNDRTWMSQGGFQISPDQNEFAFSPDGRFLASCGMETVLWETATGRRLPTVVSATSDSEQPIYSVVFAADSRWLIAAGTSGELQVWDVATRRRVHRFHAHLAGIRCLAISLDGKTLATGSGAGLIKLWRLEPPDGRFSSRWAIRELLTLSKHQAAILSLRFSPTGDILGSSDADGVVRLWRADPAP